MHRVAALLIPIILLATQARAVEDYVSPRIGILEAGIYCPAETIDRRPSPGTSAGHTDIIDGKPMLISTSRIVEMRPDNSFGVYAQLADPADFAAATIRITHPPFRNERETTVELDISTFVGGSASGYTFTFDYPYEMVTGEWIFEALDGEELLYSVTFTVIPATSNGPRGCGPAQIS